MPWVKQAMMMSTKPEAKTAQLPVINTLSPSLLVAYAVASRHSSSPPVFA